MSLIGGMLDRRYLSNRGPLVVEFEARLAEMLQVRNVVAVCNGTMGLQVAARALGMRGEVVMPSYTFIATAHALHWQGIRPRFADIEASTHNISIESATTACRGQTSGIVGVHLWGRPCEVDRLERLAASHGIPLLLDASHAFGCRYRERPVGGRGNCEVFSFHATKFFNALEGGCIATDDDELAEKMRLMVNFGFGGYDSVIHPGVNGKMTEASAAMGLTNLESLEKFRQVNRRHHAVYSERLDASGLGKLLSFDESTTPNYQYVVLELDPALAAMRDDLVDHLRAHNVLARRYFWPGCHRMSPYRELEPDVGCFLPNTESAAARSVVLPTGTAVEDDDVEDVCGLIRDWGDSIHSPTRLTGG